MKRWKFIRETQGARVDLCIVVDDFAIKITSTDVAIEREVWVENGEAVVLRRCPTETGPDNVRDVAIDLQSGNRHPKWKSLPRILDELPPSYWVFPSLHIQETFKCLELTNKK